ncbi:hypothetical protein [Burkholderia ubonensis]|uniref:hypothetical protein n=1 Tax=Burkholderia ubonensis TaxID=101571 RepID=UPI00114CDE5A|nr:hypothetical protein [Burkholderia ubonensis]
MKTILTEKISSYGKGRCFYILMIWAALGMLIWLLRLRIPKSQILVGDANLLDVEQLKAFADYHLVIALSIGVALVVVAYLLVRFNTRKPDGEHGVGLTFIYGVLDEVSSASTHFAWLTVLYFLLKNDFSTAAWLHLLYTLGFFALAIITYSIEPPNAPARTNSGSAVCTESELPSKATFVIGRLRADDYGVRIVSPKDHAEVGETCRVSGTIEKELPQGYKLWVLRRWSSEPKKFYPSGEAVIEPTQDGKSFEWHAEKCHIGGRPNSRDGRILEAWIVGPDGLRLLGAWLEFDKRFWDVQRNVEGVPALSPPLCEPTSDMEKCNTRRDVVRV